DAMRAMFTQYMAEQLGGDEALLAKVTPTYPPFVKRMLQDNGSWLTALTRENVDLVTDRIASIGPAGIRCEDGTEHAVDVIVFATGFHANRFLWPMEIVGRDGERLRERWGTSRARISASRCRATRTSSASTVPARISRTPGASSS